MGELESFPGFVTLGFHTLRILNRLRCEMQMSDVGKEQDGETGSQPDSGGGAEKHPDDRAKYVEQRLRELAAFEENASGKRIRKSRLR